MSRKIPGALGSEVMVTGMPSAGEDEPSPQLMTAVNPVGSATPWKLARAPVPLNVVLCPATALDSAVSLNVMS